MTVSRRTTAVTAAALSAMLALAACNGAEPVVGPTGSSSSTPSKTTTAPPTTTTTSKATTTTPTPTVDPVLAKIPKAARPETMEGAGAYMEFYFSELNKAFRDGNTATLDLLATPACETCKALSAGVADLREQGQRYGGDLANVNYSTASEFTPKTRRVLVDLLQQAVPILDSKGKQVGTTPRAQTQFVATLQFSNRWNITKLQRLSS